MKRFVFIMTGIIMATCTSCSDKAENILIGTDSEMSLNEQTLEQLGVENTVEEIVEYMPLNYEKQVGMWFTYMDYQDILMGKNEAEFTESISERFENAKNMGINTLYVHVRAFNDSYYYSDIFPKGEYFNGNYDPLEIITREAHELELSVHAWINPLRCQTEENVKVLGNEFIIKKWYNEKNGTYIVKHGDYMYLNPAYSEVRDYISDGFGEIAEKYEVDGFHIDDYFYPTTDKKFDVSAFSESGSTNLSQWRIENVNKMVKDIYDTIKKVNSSLIFGISPQGNILSNYDSQYADVRKWASETGYCDYIVPQIYFGFENESCPFKGTVDNWKSLNNNDKVNLIIGICTYKIGNEDKWAGSGKNEWINNEVVSKQVEYCVENSLGIAVYSYDSTFNENISNQRKKLEEVINRNY